MSISKNYIMAGMLASALVVPLSDVTDSHASEIRVTTARVHFRTGAGTNYSSMGVLDEGTKVTYLSSSGNWTKVQYNSKTGYICSDYLEKEQSTSTTSTMYVTPDVGLNVRKGPGTSYSKITKLSKGTAVTVHSTSNGWSKITANGVEGYVSSEYLSSKKPSSSNGSTSTTKTMYVTPDVGLNVRKGPGTSYSKITKLSKGTAVTVHSTSNGWSKITANGVEGYVSSEYLSSKKPSTGSSDSSNSSGSTSSSVNAVLNLAAKQLGKPYVWGAQGPSSFDCSGLTYYVYKNAAGVTLPRVSSDQSRYGTTVSKSNLKAGDLVFFDTSGSNNGAVSHVGIYVGNGEMIHASSSKEKIVQVSIETSYWNNAYVRAKRVL
ncbi:C40 family peptidase [Terrisporobacter muris]|uniref:SH3 domain-containing protein n=2 Tax=Terrisporobacter TaxID=1505652 RepID=A0A9X2MEQ6_9FIRM|nr:C40 family peptidase [Terrisporobacter muris]MCR1824876.1 SH3 domain-containing protein [Terrisporobacter muris]